MRNPPKWGAAQQRRNDMKLMLFARGRGKAQRSNALAAALAIACISCVLPAALATGAQCAAEHLPSTSLALTVATCPSRSRLCSGPGAVSGAWRPCTVAADGHGEVDAEWLQRADVRCEAGHYRPPAVCEFTRAVLRPSGKFVVPGRGRQAAPPKMEGGAAYAMLGVRHSAKLGRNSAVRCAARERRPAVALPITYHFGHGNWYHTVLDALLPLYALLRRRGWLGATGGLLLPFVEHGGLGGRDAVEGVDWSTDAFSRPLSEQFWSESLGDVFPQWQQMPLTNSTLHAMSGSGRGGLCLDMLQVGVPRIRRYAPRDSSGRSPSLEIPPELIDSFVDHVVGAVGLSPPRASEASLPCRGALVVRNGRRRILNRDALVGALGAAEDGPLPGGVHLLNFDGMTVKQQIAAVQQGGFDVILGMQGAGMTNALWAPAGTPVIMLHQFGAAGDPFAQLLASRGPYATWTNTNRSRSFADEERDPYHASADTEVDVDAVVATVERTLRQSAQRCQSVAAE